MLEFYKIKSPFDGDEQYSSGLRNGYIHKSKKGKTWNSIGHVKSHLSMTQRIDEKAFDLFYDSWIVVRITLEGMEDLGTVKEFREKSGCWMG